MAFLDRTLRFDDGRMSVRYRAQPLLISPGTPLTSVVRVETRGRAPEIAQADAAAALVASALHTPRVAALQIDFDARRSDRPFYAALIKAVRAKIPRDIPLSITALASWCVDDPWIDTHDVDEIVPMLFQMGPDARHVLTRLAEDGRWPVAACNGAAGLATDERHDRLPPAHAVYVFNPRAWTLEDFSALNETTSNLQLPTPKKARALFAGIGNWFAGLGSWKLGVGSWLRGLVPAVQACGPWFETEVFAWPNGPEDPSYYSGNIGIFQPTYDRKHLVVAWRTLAGRPLTDAERSAYVPARETQKSPAPEEVWLAARRSTGVPGAPARIDRDGFLPTTYSYVVNCGDSALLTAAKTLEDRRNSPAYQPHEFEAWVETQDLVFGNCSMPDGAAPRIPEPLPASSSALAKADRAYQIAAARFYAGDFNAAEAAFDDIAKDGTSPWHVIAPYLAARAIVRQGTMGGKDSGDDPVALGRAEQALEQLAANGPPELRQSSGELVRFVQMHLRPMPTLASAAAALRVPESDPARFRHRLSEFDKLMGRIPAGQEPDDELVDWVETVRNLREEPVFHAMARWRSSGSEAWLAAALINATAESAEVPSLLDAAAHVASGSAAFPLITFHRARLLLTRGDIGGARAVLDSALSRPGLSASTVNQLKAARLLTARTLDEFLGDAVRTPVPGWNDGDWYSPDAATHTVRPAFDADSLDAINERMSIAVLRRAAANANVPPHLRRQLLPAVLARAILLGEADVVRALVPEVSRANPTLAGPLKPLVVATDSETLLSEGWLLLLSQPGLRPFLPFGTYREPDRYAELDQFRDNWWCSFKPARDSVAPYMTPNWARGGARFSGAQRSLYQLPDALPTLRFLTADERQAARDEWQRLVALDAAPTELERRAIAWVDAHPDNPRAPHVLAQAVRAGHLGCSDETTWPLSKKAFTILHQRYPKSTAAAKTRYWYK